MATGPVGHCRPAGRRSLVLVLAPLLAGLPACDDGTAPEITDPRLVRAVSAGWNHTCAITGDDVLYCWGWGFPGQLGNGEDAMQLEPVEVTLPEGVEAFATVTAGGRHTCALTTTEEAYCWGDNGGGAVGDGGEEYYQRVPSRVAAPARFTSIVAGYSHTCALTADGTAYCWGVNWSGQLGDGTTEERTEPVKVATSERFRQLSAGDTHTCGLTTAGETYCWGDNRRGQVGDGTSGEYRLEPTPVEGDHAFASVHAGTGVTCGLTAAGGAYCWGQGGRNGDGTGEDRAAPGPVAGDVAFRSLAVGSHACGLSREDEAYCWGPNASGQLGTGTRDGAHEPVAVATSERFTAVSAGYSHTCAATPGGVLFCWGDNYYGQLGDGGVSLGWLTPVAVWRW